jgi:hypothetical protein
MIDEALDVTTHDMAYANNDGSVVSDRSQVAQNIEIRLRLIYGEWFLNTQIGVPWFEKVFVKNPDLSAVDIIIKSTISETPEVAGIVAYSSSVDGEKRKLIVSFVASTEYGTVSFSNMEL